MIFPDQSRTETSSTCASSISSSTFASACFAVSTTTLNALSPAFARTSYGIGRSYLSSLAPQAHRAFALQLLEETFDVLMMLGLRLWKSGENG